MIADKLKMTWMNSDCCGHKVTIRQNRAWCSHCGNPVCKECGSYKIYNEKTCAVCEGTWPR